MNPEQKKSKPGFIEFIDNHPGWLNLTAAGLLFWAEKLVRTEIRGEEHLQAAADYVNSGRGGLLVVPNHIGYLDAKLMQMVKQQINPDIPFKIFLANKYVGLNDDGSVADDSKNRVVGKMAAYASRSADISLIPVAQSVTSGEALRQTMGVVSKTRDESLGKNGVLGVFPEGTRSKDGSLQLAKKGAVFGLFRNNPEIQEKTLMLPMAVQGTEKIISLSPTTFRPLEKIVVSYGKPFSYDEAMSEAGEYGLSLADVFMLHIGKLIPKKMWGAYTEVFEKIIPKDQRV